MKQLRNYFHNKSEMSEKDYFVSRLCFIIDGAFATGAVCFIAATYLTGLLGEMGASAALTNFILSLNLPTGIIQILVPIISRKLKFKKPFVFTCRFFDKFLQILAFLTPFIFGTGAVSVAIMCVLIILGNLLAYVMTPFFNDIFIRCASHGGGLGKYCGTKDSVSNVCSALCSFAAGLISKHFISDGSIGGYAYLGIVALFFWAVGIISFFFVKEPCEPVKTDENAVGYRKIFSDMFGDKKLKSYMKFAIFYNTGAYMVSSLISIICIQRVHISLEYMSYLGVATLVAATLLAPVLGNLSDKIGNKKVLVFGLTCLGATYMLHGLMNERNALVLKTVAAVLQGVSSAAISAPSFSFLCGAVPNENRASYLSCISTVTLVVGYLASLAATAVLGAANGFYITLFGMKLYEINLLFFVATAFLAVSCAVLLRQKNEE